MQQIYVRAAASLLHCGVHCLVGTWMAQAVVVVGQLSATDCLRLLLVWLGPPPIPG